jgi:hypothetical protein
MTARPAELKKKRISLPLEISMHSDRKTVFILALCLVASVAGGQGLLLTNGAPPQVGFVDISDTGTGTGTAILGVQDDSMHNIVTTVGNTFFPAGPVRIGSNGVAIAGLSSGTIGFDNFSIPSQGTPENLPPGGKGYAMVFWDDLQPVAGSSNTTIWWQESGGVLYILWKGISHFQAVPGQVVTFELQVFSNPSSCSATMQWLYPDTLFGGSHAFADNGDDATIGYAGGGTLNPLNITWSFNGSFAVLSGDTVTLRTPATLLQASSPFGPGSLQLNWGASMCQAIGGGNQRVLAVTLNQGTFPNGWLYGVDIPVSQLVAEISLGAPFVGEGNSFTIGPFGGLPSGVGIYAVVLGFNSEGVFANHSNPIGYVIP